MIDFPISTADRQSQREIYRDDSAGNGAKFAWMRGGFKVDLIEEDNRLLRTIPPADPATSFRLMLPLEATDVRLF